MYSRENELVVKTNNFIVVAKKNIVPDIFSQVKCNLVEPLPVNQESTVVILEPN